MGKYRVIVGNAGTVHNTESLRDAKHEFTAWVLESKGIVGRPSGETVTLMGPTGIIKEYDPRVKARGLPVQIVESEEPAEYRVTPAPDTDDAIIAHAIAILTRRMRTHNNTLDSPSLVKDYLRLTLAPKDHEVFVVLFLDVQNRLLHAEEMFRGTLTQTSVYPREVVKAALTHNAAAVILAHNHPSGSTTPSRADEALTQTLKAALALVDVRVLDHVVVGAMDTLSFAERGLL